MPLVPMPTLVQAVKALYKTASGVPELWLDEVPEDVAGTYPQAILTHGGEQPQPDAWDETTGTPTIVHATWTFDFFVENNSDDAETIAVNVMTVFKPDALLVSFDDHLRCFRTGYQLSRASDRSTAAKPVYRASVTYRAQFGTDY